MQSITENDATLASEQHVAAHGGGLPAPMTPQNCDLSKCAWMPLTIAALKGSRTWMRCKRNPELAFYLINLWTAAWHQTPAASLDDDDDYLCDLSQCDPQHWPAVRESVMAGWQKCSDGRLYHKFVAEEAVKTFAFVLKNDAKREKDRQRLADWREAKRLKAEVDKAAAAESNAEKDETCFETRKEHVRNEAETPITRQDNTKHNHTEQKKEEKKEKEVVTAKAATSQKGHRLPLDWQPTVDDIRYAMSLGIDAVNTAEAFRDYWHAAATPTARKLDWRLAWKTWCRRERDNNKNRPKPSGLDENTRRIAELEAELTGNPPPPPDDFFAGTTLDGDFSLVQ